MSNPLKIAQSENLRLSRKDFVVGSAITFALLMAFIFGSSGMSLIATFVPGLIFAWSLFAYLYFKKIDLPNFNIFVPIYLLTLGWQFFHFSEEFITNFQELFPIAYGGQAYTKNTFVAFNMSAYFVFIAAPVLVYFKRQKFLFLPILFFSVYGTMGNAISHTWWRVYFGEYFPGFYTSQLYWVLAPILLTIIIKSKKATGLFFVVFSIVLITILTLLIK